MRTLIAELAKLRAVIGFLGEEGQCNWWQSSFFSSASQAFLKPIYPRTILVAQSVGVTRAAALVHDNYIGIGDVYHLFRLPEDMEQDIHKALHQPELDATLRSLLKDSGSARDYLRKFQGDVKKTENDVTGPVYLGDVAAMRKMSPWQSAAGYYLAAFENNTQIFPYFGNRA